jgi:hypothetical protein
MKYQKEIAELNQNPHPTDDFCHWSTMGRDELVMKVQMRKDYDLLAEVDKDALTRLLLNAFYAGSNECLEIYAGADM